mgnify:CR=1 FL=1
MSAPRFHLDLPLAPGARFSLPPGPARHAARALRLGVDFIALSFVRERADVDSLRQAVSRMDAASSSDAAVERVGEVRALLATVNER